MRKKIIDLVIHRYVCIISILSIRIMYFNHSDYLLYFFLIKTRRLVFFKYLELFPVNLEIRHNESSLYIKYTI